MKKGNQFLEVGRTKLGAKYVLGALAPKNNPSYPGPFDCAEFVSWVVFQVTGKLYGCQNNKSSPEQADAYTGFWERDVKNGTVIKISPSEAAKTVGAILLRYPAPGAIGHIIFSDGTGESVEAHSSKHGVKEDVVANRRWDVGILIPDVVYETKKLVKINPPKGVFRLTDPIMYGEEVRQIQLKLKEAGFPIEPDGRFGKETAKTVAAYQKVNGLIVDGEVGAATLIKLGLLE